MALSTLSLLLIVAALGRFESELRDIYVSTTITGNPTVIDSGTAIEPWGAYVGHPDIEASSYKEFYIKSDSPRTVTILAESRDLVVMTPFIFLTIPEPNDRSKIHVAQEVTLCTEWESFFLYFSCMRSGLANITIDISEISTHSRFMFTKSCSQGGIREDLAIYADGEAVVHDGVVAEGWLDGSKIFNGTVAFTLEISQGNQFIEDVVLTSPLELGAKGPGASGGYLTDQPLDLIVLIKECRTERVNLFLKMPPYDILRLTWTNQCNEPPREEIIVRPEVTLAFQYDTETYRIASNSTMLMSIPPQENLIKFTLSSDLPMSFAKPLLTFKQYFIGSYLLQPELTYTANSLSETPAEFTLEFRCFNEGT